MAGLILGLVTLLVVAQCCAVLQQGNAAWARSCYWELLLLVSHNKLGVLLLSKDYSFRCLSSCFMPPKFHTFSGDYAPGFLLPLPQVAQPAHALQDLYLISLFISKELLKICRLFNSCILRWKKLNEENNGPSAQSVSIMFVQEAFSNYYFCRGTQIQTNCTLTPHTSDNSNDHSNVMGRKNTHYILLNHFWRKKNYSILKNEKQNFVSPFFI